MSDLENKYEKFFKKIEKFKEEEQQQKLRGLNNYNIMGVLRKLHAEVGMHSNFIYSLLDIDGEHYQDDLFANLFVKYVLNIDDFGKIKKVEMEENADGRRIDFTIKSDRYYIGIEMKIYASDEPNQIFDYHKNLMQKSNDDKKQNVKIYYLTLDGKQASYNSHKDKPYTSIAFNREILKWLEKSQKQVSNITNLNNAIGYYTDVVNKLLGRYTSNIKPLYEYILEDKELYSISEEIYKGKVLPSSILNKDLVEEIKSVYKTIIDNQKMEERRLFIDNIKEDILNLNFTNLEYKIEEHEKVFWYCLDIYRNDSKIIRIFRNDLTAYIQVFDINEIDEKEFKLIKNKNQTFWELRIDFSNQNIKEDFVQYIVNILEKYK